jgi:hypothetical protein
MMNLSDIQAEIGAWHEDKNGPNCPAVFRRIWGSFGAEFKDSYAKPTAEGVSWMIIILLAYAHRMDWDISAALREKFDIVKARDQVQRDRDRGI